MLFLHKPFKMIKKKTAALFILFANIIIEAHAVIPHHHLPHNAFLVISSLCRENIDGHHHPQDYPDYNHDHSSNNHENKNYHFLLKQDVGIPTNILRQVSSSNNLKTNSHTAFAEFHAIPAVFKFDCIAPVIIADLQPPLLTSCYAGYTSGISGLRAPPGI